jgi:hypothetical protein
MRLSRSASTWSGSSFRWSGFSSSGDVAVAQVVGGAHQVARRAVLGAVAHDEHRLRGGLHAHEAAVVGDEYVAAAHDGAARQEDAEPAA